MEENYKFCPYHGKPLTEDGKCINCGTFIKKPKWKKNLYEKQPFEDSFVDESFLASLITQGEGKKYEFWNLVENTTEITHAINAMVLFFGFFGLAYSKALSEEVLLGFEYLFLFCGYATYTYLTQNFSLKPAKTGLLLLGTLFTLCPVLETINKNYADDTIFLMTFIFSLFHLIFYDYGFISTYFTGEASTVPGVTSMNCALISTLLLSSRLSSLNYVFFMLSLAFIIFGFLPYLRCAIKLKSETAYRRLGFFLTFLNAILMMRFSWLLSVLVLGSFYFIRYIGPMWLISVYHYKNEVKGPWDLPNIKSSNKDD
ncbi:unnamed protein product [Blepharisma stoltei]|uniref:Phosphatidylinositol N-acetylglucosaminyltransferase n=1 Tax=Blepharisma stoltei TaxID=1481888 RepID=A0AAU9J284_9CILI|nr:unnamed protein product [Blepharisma stoltei]